MAEYAEDPSLLTKEKLKNELIANNIVLPSGQHPKDVYVQLYRQHLSSRNRATPEFSSDEERESTPVRGRGRPPGRKATKKTDKPTVEGKNDQDITSLSNDALKEELLKYGVKPGPILGSTRKVYEQRLLKLKEQQDVVSIAPPVAELSTADNKQNGNTDSTQYSDNDEPRTDLAFEPREPLRSKPKAQVASRSKRLEQNEIIEKTFTEEKREERDILKQMFPYETTTPTGISASCRRPIKGASGRPFNLKDYKDYKLEESYSSKYLSKYQPVIEEKTSTKGKSGRSIPIWIKFIILLILVVLGFLVYQAMESNAANPFAKWLQGNQNLNKEEN
ncbi:thymopoietin isoform X7 [Hyla sarda]|uniref:thymopoietin isoform X7 n=1 Tax=Hyla sarda TaxID=327740 RepID=UPI0024C43684|nr:thymopoietin isoform X7 [Hyla sarda]